MINRKERGKMSFQTSVVLVLLACVAGSLASEAFFNKYAYTKAMESCFGNEAYDIWYARAEKARQACYGQQPDTNIVQTALDNAVNTAKAVSGSKAPLFPRQMIDAVVKYADYRVSNFTCQMQTLGYLKDDLSLDYQRMEEELKNISQLPEDFKADLINGLHFCRDVTNCVDFSHFGKMTPTQNNVYRAIHFLNCDKKVRIKLCMKRDIMEHLDEFDTSGMPEKDPQVLAVKLMKAFVNVEGNDDLKLF